MSDLKRRIGRNSFWKLAGDGSRGLLALFLILIARRYGPAAFGAFSLLYAAAIVFSIAADFGLNLLITRQVAAHKGAPEAYLRTFFACKLAILPLWIAVPAAIFKLGGWSAGASGVSGRMVFYFAAAFAARNVLEFFGSVFSGFELIEYEAVIKLSSHVVMLGAGLWFMRRGLPIESMGAALLWGYGAGAVVGGLWCERKWGLFPLALHPSGLAVFYAEAWPIILMGASLAALTKWNTLALGFMHVPAAQIGWFGASEKIVSALEVLPALVTAASYPVLADLHRNDPARYASAQNRLVAGFLGVGALCAAAVLASSGVLIPLLFGPSYAGARLPLCILGASLVPAFANILLLNTLVATGRSWDAAGSAVIACAANAALTLWMIPLWGIAGTAAASALSQAALLSAALVFLKSRRRRPPGSGPAPDSPQAHVA